MVLGSLPIWYSSNWNASPRTMVHWRSRESDNILKGYKLDIQVIVNVIFHQASSSYHQIIIKLSPNYHKLTFFRRWLDQRLLLQSSTGCSNTCTAERYISWYHIICICTAERYHVWFNGLMGSLGEFKIWYDLIWYDTHKTYHCLHFHIHARRKDINAFKL